MNSVRINILNPKAFKLLKNLADLNLISIKEESKNGFDMVLNKLRSQAKKAPSLDEITIEVEKVRTTRHEK